MGEFVRVERDGAIATIRLDRPPMNALNAQVQDEIAAAAAEVDADPGVRAVVLYGGEKGFAAGGGNKEKGGGPVAPGGAGSRPPHAALPPVARVGKPAAAGGPRDAPRGGPAQRA